MLSVFPLNNNELKNLKILLVEDNQDEAELIQELFLESYRVPNLLITHIDSLQKAQAIVTEEIFDVILLDLSLPDSQGFDTVYEMQEYSLSIPIVVLTGYNDEQLALQLIQAGVQDYLIKTKITREVLIRSIRYAIERQQTQQILKQSEAKYRSIVENSLVGIVICEPEETTEKLIEVNDAFCHLMGYEREEILNKNWLDLTAFDDRAANIVQSSQICQQEDDRAVFDTRLLRKDGQIVYTRVSVRCIRHSNGAIDHLIKVILDVTDYKTQEAQLKEREIRLIRLQTAQMNLVKSAEIYTGNFADSVEIITEIAGKTLEVEQTSIWFYQEKNSEIQCANFYQLSTERHRRENQISEREKCRYVDAIEIAKLRTVTQANLEEKIGGLNQHCDVTNPSITSILDVPIRYGGKTVGIICLEDTGNSRNWSIEEQSFAAYLADMVTLAMESRDRVEAENLLRKSENRFQRLVANIPGMIYQFNLTPEGEKKFTYVSSGCREIYEREPEYLQENTDSMFSSIYADDLGKMLESVEISGTTLQPWRMEWRQVMPSGIMKWLQGASRPEKQADGTIVWDGLVLDITELKRITAERDRFFTISLDFLFIAGTDGYVKRFNPSLERTFGYSYSELTSRPYLDFLHLEDKKRTQKQIQRLIGEKTSDFYLENRVLCQDGSYKWISWSASFFEEEGLIYAAGRDITERKKAEEALRDSQRLIQKIADSSPYILYLYDLEKCRNIYINHLIYDVLGYTIEEIREMEGSFFLLDLVHPDDLERIYDYHNQIKNSGDGDIFEIDYRIKHKDGRWCWFTNRDTVFARDSKNKPTQILGTSTDITEQKQAEEDLRSARARLEHLLASSPAIIYSCKASSDYVATFISNNVHSITGYQPDDFIKNYSFWREHIHPEDRERILRELHLLWEQDAHAYEYRFLVADGTYIWLRDSIKVMRDEMGIPTEFVGCWIDVSETYRHASLRKKAENALRIVTQAVESTSDAICITDSKNFFIYQNKAFSQRYGYSLEELNQKLPHPLYHTQENWKSIFKMIRRGSSWSGEVELITKYGEFVPTFVRVDTIKDETENIIGLIAVITDITERKRTEKKLALLLQNLQEAQAIAHIGNWEFDVFNSTLIWSDELKRIFGLKPEDRVPTAQECLAIIHPEDRDLWRETFQKSLTEGISYDIDFRIQLPDGSLRYLDGKGEALRNENNQVIRLFGTAMDITERKQVEEALRQNLSRERLIGASLERIRQSLKLEEVLKTAVEEVRHFLSTDRTIIYHFQGDGSGLVVVESVREIFLSIAGEQIEDICFNKDYASLYQQGRISAVEDIYQANLQECHIELLSQFQVRANLVVPIVQGDNLWGLLIAHHCSSPRFWHSAEIESLRQLCVQLAIAIQQSLLFEQAQTEIMERKQTEIALQKAKVTAEAANRAKTEFLANMSHEVRTPLNGILGYVQILKNDKTLSDDQQEMLNNIHLCGDHLLTLINDILDLSKIEARKMELLLSELNFPNFLKGIAHLFEMRSSQKGIRFKYEELSRLPQGIKCDEKRLRQVLINLLSNAVKFTNQGVVTFKVSVIHSERSTELNHQVSSVKIRFEVEDTGIGIPENKLEEIFLPFHQVDIQSQLIEGTGLGLAISQKLAKMMGSKINVKSVIGKGSSFWLDLNLPLLKGFSYSTPGKQHRILGYVGEKRKILIVDDNQVNRALLVRLLSRLGFDIREAINGEEGLTVATSFSPDVILLDLLMPVMDGFEATRKIRAIPHLQNVIIFAVSASVFENTKEESRRAGCDYFLSKPLATKQLLEGLRRYLGLEWIYEEQSLSDSPVETSDYISDGLAKSPPDIMVPPSEKAVSVLFKLVMSGDIEGIEEETGKLQKLDPNLDPFINHLRQLTKEFKMKQLREFLKQFLPEKKR
jgi:PAS domain S-box-containing protein